MAATNGNGHAADPMARVFPEALTPLEQADPEIYALVQDEKKRQWCVLSLFRLAAAAAVPLPPACRARVPGASRAADAR
jgi:hypothetical protein